MLAHCLLQDTAGLTSISCATAQVTDVGLCSLTGLEFMEYLDIAGCVAVTERGIAAVATALPRLATLKV